MSLCMVRPPREHFESYGRSGCLSEVRSQKSEGRGLDRYLAALPAMKYKCGSHLIPLANSTNAVALNAAPNAATRSGNLFLVQRTRFPALLEMILRGIGKTHF